MISLRFREMTMKIDSSAFILTRLPILTSYRILSPQFPIFSASFLSFFSQFPISSASIAADRFTVEPFQDVPLYTSAYTLFVHLAVSLVTDNQEQTILREFKKCLS